MRNPPRLLRGLLGRRRLRLGSPGRAPLGPLRSSLPAGLRRLAGRLATGGARRLPSRLPRGLRGAVAGALLPARVPQEPRQLGRRQPAVVLAEVLEPRPLRRLAAARYAAGLDVRALRRHGPRGACDPRPPSRRRAKNPEGGRQPITLSLLHERGELADEPVEQLRELLFE